MLGVIFGLGIFALDASALIPLAGMMIGNSMPATVVVARREVGELRDKRPRSRPGSRSASVEGAPPFGRDAQRVVIPQIESTKAVGLVFLPGP